MRRPDFSCQKRGILNKWGYQAILSYTFFKMEMVVFSGPPLEQLQLLGRTALWAAISDMLHQTRLRSSTVCLDKLSQTPLSNSQKRSYSSSFSCFFAVFWNSTLSIVYVFCQICNESLRWYLLYQDQAVQNVFVDFSDDVGCFRVDYFIYFSSLYHPLSIPSSFCSS